MLSHRPGENLEQGQVRIRRQLPAGRERDPLPTCSRPRVTAASSFQTPLGRAPSLRVGERMGPGSKIDNLQLGRMTRRLYFSTVNFDASTGLMSWI